MNPFQSRKAFIAWLASAMSTAIVGWSINKGWIPPDRQTDAILALTGIISGIWSFVIAAIGIEDGGAKTGPATPEAQRISDTCPASVPKVPVAVLLLVLSLGLLASPLAAQPSLPGATATAYGTPDLSALAKGLHGRQNDKGVNWPGDFKVSKVIVLVEVTDEKTGERYWVEPTEASRGFASLHKALLAHTMFGAPVNRWNAEASLRAKVDVQLRTALSTAAGRVAAQIPALVGRGDALIAQLVAELFAR